MASLGGVHRSQGDDEEHRGDDDDGDGHERCHPGAVPTRANHAEGRRVRRRPALNRRRPGLLRLHRPTRHPLRLPGGLPGAVLALGAACDSEAPPCGGCRRDCEEQPCSGPTRPSPFGDEVPEPGDHDDHRHDREPDGDREQDAGGPSRLRFIAGEWVHVGAHGYSLTPSGARARGPACAGDLSDGPRVRQHGWRRLADR